METSQKKEERDFRQHTFEFATATRILFGAGKVASAPTEIASLGMHRPLFVTGQSGERSALLARALEAKGLVSSIFRVEKEPTIELVREAISVALSKNCDGVVAMGGGSAIDCGKAVASLVANGGDLLDYVEVLGKGFPITKLSLPFVAIPTTAGTGSEVTRNAVLGSPSDRLKISLRSPLMLARLAIVDPDLLTTAPASVMAASGIDALSQLVEPFLSVKANPLTDALAKEGIKKSARSLLRACKGQADNSAREDLAIASLFGGLCLTNAGLGAVHGFAAPCGGLLNAPHGAVCAALFAPTFEINLQAMTRREPKNPGIDKARRIAKWLTGRSEARAEDGAEWIATLCKELGIPGLGSYGLSRSDLPQLIEKAKNASSMRGNPISLTDSELLEIAERSLPDCASR